MVSILKRRKAKDFVNSEGAHMTIKDTVRLNS